jgi:hypothetical protein
MNDDPQILMERAAELMSERFLKALESDIANNWPDTAYQISKDPVAAKKFFQTSTIKLAQIYISSTNLFTEMDENSGLISGEEVSEVEVEAPTKTRFDFDEEEE